ncbi:MAG: class I SAM-dependent methyltransferase [Bacteroidetes bacterium]|nr:class I SAM-dependent methyltransferase [Bacteroidota bacterium]
MSNKLHSIKYFIIHLIKSNRRGHNIHSPFAYKLCEEVFYNHHSFSDFEPLKQIRKKLTQTATSITIQGFGAGSNTLASNLRTISSIAKHGVSSIKQAEILYRLINYFNVKRILELGTSIGLTTLYLSRANIKAHVTSIEAEKTLHNFAKDLAQKHNCNNITFINQTFEDAIFNNEQVAPYDFIYVDGNHTYSATTQYFEFFLKSITPNTIIIFDDIYWSSQMTKAWNEIKSHSKVKLSIDAYWFGLVFFKEEIKEKIDLKIML